MTATELSLRERTTYEFIRSYHAEKGYMPTMREICKALGIRSTSLASWYVEKLVQAGLIERDYAVARGIRIVEVGE